MSQDPLEILWDGLLSRDEKRITYVFQLLDKPSQLEVINHLNRMVSEEGWHPEQVLSAQAALNTIESARVKRN